ncbi:MAG: hypothetical protein M3R50_02155 [Bacteroidota bacterium]|nr:hypothetical protein [Bacteroidota bacterium]
MKSGLTVLVFSLIVLLFSQCDSQSDTAVNNNKDLRENMQDMMIYHDNLGTQLRKGDADEASWFLEGMDSSLQVIAATFEQHRKLTEPFKKTYQKRLQPAIKDIRKSLAENNFPNAINAYRILTKNCNNCHAEHHIDEEVLDLTHSASN